MDGKLSAALRKASTTVLANYVGYELRVQAKGGDAGVRGLEVSFRDEIAKLPGFWRKFTMFANYTWLESEGDYSKLGSALTSNQRAGIILLNASFGFSYIQPPLVYPQLRLRTTAITVMIQNKKP